MKPGIYTIPEAQYFAVHAFSNSLGQQMLRSAQHGYTYLTRTVDEEPTEAQVFGKLCHKAVFEPHRMNQNIAVKPKGMSFATKEGKAWREAQGTKEIVPAKDMDRVAGIVKSVYANPDASRILKTVGGKAEQSIFVNDPETGVLLKCRPDFYGGNFIVDGKSTRTADPDEHGFPREIALMRYYVQAAFYLDVARLAGLKVETFLFIAFEKEPPFACTVFQLDEMSLAKGREEYKRALKLYAECLKTNVWPGYTKQMEIVSIPDWALRRQPFESAIAYEMEATQ
jgi:hypothetical protein